MRGECTSKMKKVSSMFEQLCPFLVCALSTSTRGIISNRSRISKGVFQVRKRGGGVITTSQFQERSFCLERLKLRNPWNNSRNDLRGPPSFSFQTCFCWVFVLWHGFNLAEISLSVTQPEFVRFARNLPIWLLIFATGIFRKLSSRRIGNRTAYFPTIRPNTGPAKIKYKFLSRPHPSNEKQNLTRDWNIIESLRTYTGVKYYVYLEKENIWRN